MLIAAIIVPMGPAARITGHRMRGRSGSGGLRAWQAWRSDRALGAVLVLVVLAGAAAAVGLVLLWPTGEGRDAARERADEIGLTYQRLAATVEEVTDRACSYSAPDDPQACRTITVRVDEGSNAGTRVALPEFNLAYDRSPYGSRRGTR